MPELDNIKMVMSTKEEKNIKEKHHGVFQGLGCLHELYHIEIDPEIIPVINPPRKIPVAIKDRLKAEFEMIRKFKESFEKSICQLIGSTPL